MRISSVVVMGACVLTMSAGLLAQPESNSLAGPARSAFLDVDAIAGITVSFQGPGSALVDVGGTPTFTYQAVTYTITDVFGFWALSNTGDIVNTLTSTFVDPNTGTWKDQANNGGPGGTAGWSTNPNTGLTPLQSLLFVFDAYDAGEIEQFGFHVRLDGTFPGTSGDTGFITVPAPASAATLLAVGALAARRRRH